MFIFQNPDASTKHHAEQKSASHTEVKLQMRIFSYTHYKGYPPSSCTTHSNIPKFHTTSTSKEWLPAAALETEACDSSGFFNTTLPLVRMHVSSQKHFAAQDMRQMTKESSDSSVYFLQAQVALPFLQWGDFTAGWAGSNWSLQNGRSMIYSWWRISTDHTC